MAFAYSIKDEQGIYFVTFTVNQWADVFTRQDYVDVFLNSIRYCQKEKGLLIYEIYSNTNCKVNRRERKRKLKELVGLVAEKE